MQGEKDEAPMSRLQTSMSVAAVEAAAARLRASDDAAYDPAHLAPDAHVRVQVLAALPDGGSRARLLDSGGELHLPFKAAPGTVLDVLVSRDAHGALVVSMPGTPQEDTAISTTARLLGALAQARVQTAPSSTAAARPLVTGAPLDTAALARALAHTLELSGLFYEAHQAQWVAGTRTREQLLQEPQARLQLGDGSEAQRPAEASPAAQAGGAASAPLSSALDGVVHRDAQPLVQQQLAALENGVVLWRGEAWRGQQIEWEVRRERASSEEEPAAVRWQTRVNLKLPRLGEVGARIGVGPRGVTVAIAAADGAAAAALHGASGALAAALANAGLGAARIEVAHGDARAV